MPWRLSSTPCSNIQACTSPWWVALLVFVIWLFSPASLLAADESGESLRRGITAYRATDFERARRLLLDAASKGSPEASRYLGDIYRIGQGVAVDPSEAIRWYRDAAKGGDSEALFQMALLYQAGQGVPADPKTAFEFARSAADRGHLGALEYVADAYWLGSATERDYAAAVAIYRPLAGVGTLVALERLGIAYFRGYGVPVNYVEAARYFEQAASRGSTFAAGQLGLIFLERLDGASVSEASLDWLEKAAAAGNPNACFQLGKMYASGSRVKVDEALARRYLRCASNRDNAAEVAYLLGTIALQPKFGSPDYEEAARHLQICSDAGNTDCIDNLGWLYLSGRGVVRDYRRARAQFERAWQDHSTYAATYLGHLHEGGYGVVQDFEVAAQWYWRGAVLGDGDAQRELSRMYEFGRGVPVDLVEAHKWINVAATSEEREKLRDELVKIRDRVAKKMSVEEIKEAQRKARAWAPILPSKLEAATSPSVNSSESPSRAPGAGNRVVPKTSEKLAGSGSGFWVTAQGHLLTAKHVVAECSQLRVLHEGVDQGRAEVVAQDPQEDVAVLKVDVRPPQVGVLRVASARQGEDVVAYGFPLGSALSASGVSTSGTVNALAGLGNSPSTLQISAPVQPGNSGGPLVDSGGSVIGIVVSKLDALKLARATGDVPQNVNFAVKVSVASNLLDASGVSYATASSRKALGAAEITERARAIAVRVDCYR